MSSNHPPATAPREKGDNEINSGNHFFEVRRSKKESLRRRLAKSFHVWKHDSVGHDPTQDARPSKDSDEQTKNHTIGIVWFFALC